MRFALSLSSIATAEGPWESRLMERIALTGRYTPQPEDGGKRYEVDGGYVQMPGVGSITMSAATGIRGDSIDAIVAQAMALAIDRNQPECSICRGRHGPEIVHACE